MPSTSLPKEKKGKLRPLNVLLDLPKVAKLVDLCFHKNTGDKEKRYLQQTRADSPKSRYLSWASNSLPLKGYIWQEQKEIVGNISIIPFRKGKEDVILLANIAVHPDYRRMGIARQLTQKGIEYARQRGATSIWLHAKEDDLGAVKLYKKLDFHLHSRRTTWVANTKLQAQKKHPNTIITPRTAHFWEAQNTWLNRSYPAEITWYKMPDWQIFKPGLKYWLYRFFVEGNIRQWAVQKDGELQAVLTWIGTHTRRAPLWLATAPQANAESLSDLLLHVRLHLKSRKQVLTIDYPAGEFTTAFEQAGFIARRTLLWMRAKDKE